MTRNAPPSLPPTTPSHNNRDVDGYICMYLFVCVRETGRDKERDAFSASLVTLFQHVIHVDECIKQSLWNSEFCLHSRDWTMVKNGLRWSFKCGSGFSVGIAGSVRPGTDVALTFEMSLGVKAFRLQLGHLATDALMQFMYRQWWTTVGEEMACRTKSKTLNHLRTNLSGASFIASWTKYFVFI